MYLRSTKRRNQDGTEVEYFQLAHNVRNPRTGKPLAQIIHNFGRADQVNRDSLVRLCRSIARVCGVAIQDTGTAAGEAASSQSQASLPIDVKLLRTLELGPVLALEALWERLGIAAALQKIIKQHGYRVDYERALFAMAANRLCEPESKLGVWDRWLSKVYLPSCQDLKLDQMYEAMDMLQAHSTAVEEAVFFRTAHLFNLEVDLIFYDTTTAAFAIDEEDDDQGLRRFGRPKNGAWSPQVVIALAVTRDGLPVRSWVFPGQTADASTVAQIKADLRDWNLGRALFVADAGMNSQQNRQELAKACGTYLLATRLGSQAEVKEEVLARPGRFKVIAENLQAKEVIVGDGERRRRYIVCYNPLEAKRQQLHREQVLRELEAELGEHPDLKATARWAIDLLASGRYRRYLKIEAATNHLTINRQAAREAARTDGKWVLITNDDTITLEDAASGYKSLLVIERCFRALKSTQIKLTPMYHWLPSRIEAHIKICVLALLMARVAERQCQLPWKRIRDDLGALQVTQFRTPNFQFFQRHEPTENLLSTLKSLEISMPKPVLSITPTTTIA